MLRVKLTTMMALMMASMIMVMKLTIIDDDDHEVNGDDELQCRKFYLKYVLHTTLYIILTHQPLALLLLACMLTYLLASS